MSSALWLLIGSGPVGESADNFRVADQLGVERFRFGNAALQRIFHPFLNLTSSATRRPSPASPRLDTVGRSIGGHGSRAPSPTARVAFFAPACPAKQPNTPAGRLSKVLNHPNIGVLEIGLERQMLAVGRR